MNEASSRRLAAVTCVLAAALALTAACGRLPAPKAQLSAAQAVDLAARNTQRVRSLTMTEKVTIRLPKSLGHPPTGSLPGNNGGALVGPGGQIGVSATVAMQLKPTLLAEVRMNLGPHGMVLDEILTTRAIYMRLPALPALPGDRGKPWVKVSLSKLPGGITPAKLFAKLRGIDPLAANPLGVGKLLRLAKNLRIVHGPVVDGVPTTEYAGTIPLPGLATLFPAAKGNMASAPAALRKTGLPFRVWIDGQDQVRRLMLSIGTHGRSVMLTINVTSINQPVRIVLPPASKISAVPTRMAVRSAPTPSGR